MHGCYDLSSAHKFVGSLLTFLVVCDFAEKGEVLSDHYKLLPVDLRNIPNLEDVITLANMDLR